MKNYELAKRVTRKFQVSPITMKVISILINADQVLDVDHFKPAELEEAVNSGYVCCFNDQVFITKRGTVFINRLLMAGRN